MKGFAITCVGVLLVACAPHSDEIRGKEVSVEPYQNLSCSEIHDKLNVNLEKIKELAQRIEETADTDETQTAVGLILFWPILFALEGHETPEADEYAQLRGECLALENTAILKHCTEATELAKTWHEEEERARLEKERLEAERRAWGEAHDY